MALVCLMALAACRPVPKVDEARAIIGAHFAGRGYPVVEMSVRAVRALAVSEKTYMGVPAFVVELDRLVLDVEGQERTFSGVRLLLKESRSPGERYVVSDISGVPLP